MKKTFSFTFHKQTSTDVSIYIEKGALKKLKDLLQTIEADKFFIICDENVNRLYVDKIIPTLRDLDIHLLVHSADEVSKSLETLTKLSNAFFDEGGTAKSCICAVGGGVTGNIAGLLGAIVYRGITLIHIPTTLLAQVDSAADVKQSVNAPVMKNAIGTYKAPARVIIDPEVLLTLSDREIRAGLGEAVKHAFAQNVPYVDELLGVDYNDIAALEKIVQRTIELKLEHWQNTPTIWNDKHKIERLTHLGHTTGKVLEMIDVDYLTHGEAISHGMIIEAIASNVLGHLSQEDVDYMRKTLEIMKLLTPLPDNYTVQSISDRLYDKKVNPIFALLKELGNPETLSVTIPQNVLSSALQEHLTYLRTREMEDSRLNRIFNNIDGLNRTTS